MKYLVKFIKKPIWMKFMMLEALFILGYSRVIILKIPFRKIAGIRGQNGCETEFSDDGVNLELVRRISMAVQTVSRHTPWESKCLVQAYTAKIMLKRRKQKCTVYLGVAKDEEGKMIAHSWVRCGIVYVTGGNGSHFTVTGKFA